MEFSFLVCKGAVCSDIGCGKLTYFLYEYIHIKKEVSLPHPVCAYIGACMLSGGVNGKTARGCIYFPENIELKVFALLVNYSIKSP
jgi:hypothetical protein